MTRVFLFFNCSFYCSSSKWHSANIELWSVSVCVRVCHIKSILRQRPPSLSVFGLSFQLLVLFSFATLKATAGAFHSEILFFFLLASCCFLSIYHRLQSRLINSNTHTHTHKESFTASLLPSLEVPNQKGRSSCSVTSPRNETQRLARRKKKRKPLNLLGGKQTYNNNNNKKKYNRFQFD